MSVAACSLALASPALAASPDAHVDANGNAFTGGLGFDPVGVSVPLGGVVAWTNTDFIAPHTSTEDHGLWELSGTYGIPGLFIGYGPGATVERSFDAGTFHYYCVVHGRDTMHGVVSVPDSWSIVLRHGEAHIDLTWGAAKLPAGQAFDVQRRVGGHWKLVRDGTTKLHGVFPLTNDKFRSRVRKANDANAASDWSPSVRI